MEPFPAFRLNSALADAPIDPLPAGWSGPGAKPLEIDVGCHKGLFLVEMAKLYPERNFLGIERQFERVERTRKKIQAMALANAAVFRGEGFETLGLLPAACADHIHVLFPDPWPKRRHHVRRMVQPRFLALSARVVKPGGLLRLVTDDPDYAEAMRENAAEAKDFTLCDGEDREYPLTEFQKKFLADGRPVHRCILRRVS